MLDSITELLYTVTAVLLAISAHEFAHGYVSYKMGDPTPKWEGRLTLNPLAHLDLMGTLCLVVFKMGWAKPVKINPYYYSDRRKGIMAVALAGPMMNYLLAFIGMFLFGLLNKFGLGISLWFYYFAIINIGLGTFNLIPFPPLDGSNVLAALVPKVEGFYYKIRNYAMPILVIGLVTGILDKPIHFVSNSVLQGMFYLVWKVLY